MRQGAASAWFLCLVAFSCALTVAVALGATSGDSTGLRIGAALVAFALALGFSFSVLAAVSAPVDRVTTPPRPPAPPAESPPPAPVVDEGLRARLEAQLAAGRTLAEADVEAWSADTQRLLEPSLPAAARYFAAAAWPAQLARLETIVRDFL